MIVEIQIRHALAGVPKYATNDSAGVDLVACIDNKLEIAPGDWLLIDSGISINMQNTSDHCMAMIVPRSGKGCKGLGLKNFSGIIDRDYHGPVKIAAWNTNKDTYVSVDPGERIAQLIFIPLLRANFEQVTQFSSLTARGHGGFGSTGS